MAINLTLNDFRNVRRRPRQAPERVEQFLVKPTTLLTTVSK